MASGGGGDHTLQLRIPTTACTYIFEAGAGTGCMWLQAQVRLSTWWVPTHDPTFGCTHVQLADATNYILGSTQPDTWVSVFSAAAASRPSAVAAAVTAAAAGLLVSWMVG